MPTVRNACHLEMSCACQLHSAQGTRTSVTCRALGGAKMFVALRCVLAGECRAYGYAVIIKIPQMIVSILLLDLFRNLISLLMLYPSSFFFCKWASYCTVLTPIECRACSHFWAMALNHRMLAWHSGQKQGVAFAMQWHHSCLFSSIRLIVEQYICLCIVLLCSVVLNWI
jgi:hypothetical protein